MYNGVKAVLPVIFLAAVVASSGCVNLDPEAFAKAIPMIKEFLEEHPNAELHIVHYSASEAEAILDQIKEDCGKTAVEAKEYYFVNLTDPDTDLIVKAWIDWDTQTVECVYKAGGARQLRECKSHYKAICFNEHVYWVDSCGNRQEKKEYCPLGCRDGRCIIENHRICDPEKIYYEKPECVCPLGYEMIVIYPRCAVNTVPIEEAPTATDLVTGAVTAVESIAETESEAKTYTTSIQERCVGGSPVYRCVERNTCKSHAELRCYNGHVYWFDSCGHRQEKKEYCEHGCELGFCKDKNICELEGGYCVYPVACTKEAKICPDGTVVGRIPPSCEFPPCPIYAETGSASGGGGGGGGVTAATGSASGGGYATTTGMPIAMPVQEAVEVETESYIISEKIYPDYTQCRPGYKPSNLYCPKNGLCCLPGEKEYVCGNGICEPGEDEEVCYEYCPLCEPMTTAETACECKKTCRMVCPQDCETSKRCAKYVRDCEAFEVCATCGNGICEDYESCTSSHCCDGMCTADCGALYCPKDCEEEECAKEGEYTSGAVAPEYYYGCCEGLKGFDTHPPDWVGGGLLCYDPDKGIPVCRHAGTKSEGWYYSETGELLRYEDCQEDKCYDSDGGKDYYIAGVVEAGDTRLEDTCNEDGTLTERYCSGDQAASVRVSCPAGTECLSGACIKELEVCYETDTGYDIYTAGVVEMGDSRKEDYCVEDKLVEYFCGETEIKVEDYICPHGCLEGACLETECIDGATETCGETDIGVCELGIQTCTNGTWSVCEGAVNPVDEVCHDGLDNDCDGIVDEDCGCLDGATETCGETDIGECEFGVSTCIEGIWSECEGAIDPSDEICDDQLDNDCDGSVDEDCEV